ncbi:hypothetical protein Tco_0659256 [Tanacetum coccineum]
MQVVQVLLCIWTSSCSKSYDENRSSSMNLWKSSSGQSVRDCSLSAIMGYGDYVRGQFCDSDLLKWPSESILAFVRDIKVGLTKQADSSDTDNGNRKLFVNQVKFEDYSTMMIFSKASYVSMAEAVATAC